MIDGHGDDIYRYGNKVVHNFSSNVYSGFNHDGLKRHLARRLDFIESYPEPSPVTLEIKLASWLGVSPDEVMVTAGVTEAIYMIASMTAGHVSAIPEPTFSEYRDACRLNRHRIASVSEADVIWICNPNNPDGHAVSSQTIVDEAHADPLRLRIVDQAYMDYSYHEAIKADIAVQLPRLLLLGSFTKRFGVPGLRLGYVVGHRQIIEQLGALRHPWSVNGLCIEAGKYLLDNADDYIIPLEILLDESRRVKSRLSDFGIDVADSDTSFMLCRLPHGNAAALKDYLMEKHGILIRDASNFNGLTPRHFRISVQSPEVNNLLISAIEEWTMR